MPIDGLIILDNMGKPIVQSGFRSSPVAYPLLHIDAFNTSNERDPVIFVNSSPSSACCHVRCNDVNLLCPLSGDDDPLIGFAFLRTFTDILQSYFDNISATVIRNNFDVVYQLLEETLEAKTTSLASLRDIVLPPSLLNKLLSATNFTSSLNSSLNSSAGTGAFNSAIPWRKTGVRYAHNEIYFDVIERMDAIVNKSGAAVACNVWGHIDVNSRLSGTPDLVLILSNSRVLGDCAFHPCVRLQRWARDRSLSFVPPDGRFVLLDYRYSPSTTGTNGGKDNIALPFTLKPLIELHENGGSFNITLTSRLSTRPLESVVITLNLGEGATGLSCKAARGGGGGGAFAGGTGVEVGTSWGFDPKTESLRWEISNVPQGSSWSLKGTFASSNKGPNPARAFKVSYEISSYTYSSIKVEQLRLTGEAYKPYKGVRGRVAAAVEWRW